MFAPDQAIEYMKTQPSEEQSELRSLMGNMLIMSNPKKGAAFMLEGATEEEKPQRYESVINSWAHQDPNAAGNWLNEQPKGPQLDKAKRAFVFAAAEKDSPSAMVWASTITEPEGRQAATTFAYTVWKRKDPAAAEQALNASGLTAQQLDQVRASQPSGPAVPPAPTAIEVPPN
jgi:hypothetical protein